MGSPDGSIEDAGADGSASEVRTGGVRSGGSGTSFAMRRQEATRSRMAASGSVGVASTWQRRTSSGRLRLASSVGAYLGIPESPFDESTPRPARVRQAASRMPDR